MLGKATIDRVNFKLRERYFDWATAAIRQTPPLQIVPGKATFVSLVCHRDINRYLLAIKSVYNRIGRGSIVVLNDGTLTEDDKAVLDHHLGSPGIVHKDDIDTGPCPTYICWRRIMLILELCQDGYVIQVDSDVVACADLEEVEAAIEAEEAFIVVNKNSPGRITMTAMTDWVRDMTERHKNDRNSGWQGKTVQLETERNLYKHQHASDHHYLRGTAAFVGWAQGCATREDLLAFSQFIEGEIGPLWRKWGSEQTSTNYLIANAPRLKLLEYPKYMNNFHKRSIDGAALVHFYGSYRYEGGRYLNAAREAIDVLREPASVKAAS